MNWSKMRLCASSGPPCPLLPLPGNSRYKLTSVDVPDMVSYPVPQSSSSYSGHAPSSVAMVSGLHPSKMNCTRIFNLFCLYGNIEKVGVCVCVCLCVCVCVFSRSGSLKDLKENLLFLLYCLLLWWLGCKPHKWLPPDNNVYGLTLPTLSSETL